METRRSNFSKKMIRRIREGSDDGADLEVAQVAVCQVGVDGAGPWQFSISVCGQAVYAIKVQTMWMEQT